MQVVRRQDTQRHRRRRGRRLRKDCAAHRRPLRRDTALHRAVQRNQLRLPRTSGHPLRRVVLQRRRADGVRQAAQGRTRGARLPRQGRAAVQRGHAPAAHRLQPRGIVVQRLRLLPQGRPRRNGTQLQQPRRHHLRESLRPVHKAHTPEPPLRRLRRQRRPRHAAQRVHQDPGTRREGRYARLHRHHLLLAPPHRKHTHNPRQHPQQRHGRMPQRHRPGRDTHHRAHTHILGKRHVRQHLHRHPGSV